ncbi:prolyl oligopeptidase family serine peptidase [uncultured Dokdonia sp.]|uniref:prolyl oligopeptidase family serine peptidase n=1 Tax=uncultured Dokdonia sp. TaxID=575653 RepID=UPI00262BE748|nr:prolyl oligopeptidase family serine peptidase [uncultured Dokdonia sp.]
MSLKKIYSCIKICVLFFVCISCDKQSNLPPAAKSVLTTDIHHGKEIKDPYRNLENLEDSTVVKWLQSQSEYAFNILDKIPGRQRLIDKQASYNTEEKSSFSFVTYSSNGKFFYTKGNKNEDPHYIYYKSQIDSKEELLYDTRNYSKKNDYKISYIKPDWEGNNIAIALSKKGEEISEIIVLDVNTKKILPGVVKKSVTNFSGIHWLSNNTGYIYVYSPNNEPTSPQYWMDMQSIVYKLGSDPNNRIDVFSKKHDKELQLQSEDFPLIYNYDKQDGYLFAVVGGSSSFYDIYYKKEEDLLSNKVGWKLLAKKEDKIKRFKIDQKNRLVYLTSKNSSNNKLCRTPMSNINFESAEVLVKEKKERVITKFHNTKDGIYFTAQKNGIEEKLYRIENNKEIEVILPRDVSEMNIQSQSIDQNFLKISTWGSLSPAIHYLYDLDSRTFKIEPIIPIEKHSDFDNLEVKNIEIPSHDGAMVPITIIHKKGLIKNGNTPTFFYGYGSYGGTGSISFNPNFLTWAIEGGILVYSYVRGGGQKGDDWHKAGYKTTKPNTWKDMIATTEYMIKEGYTNTEKTAIWGSSAGGIMAGRAMTDRPDLYQAVILTSPALNMLRSEIQPNGKNSIKEFGTFEIKEEFEALLEMDSYHHIKKGVDYPATLVTGGMKDGRVVIWDPAKFVAKLQANNTSRNPVLFGVKFDEGHAGMDAGENERLKRYANTFSFALWQMGYKEYQPKF